MLKALQKSIKEFDFYFFCHSFDYSSISKNDLLLFFQTPLWFQSVMFYTNWYYRTLTIVSPPNHWNSFNCSLTNEFENDYFNNRYEQLKMSRIKRIFLNDKQKPFYTNEFFHLIKSIFINLQILEIDFYFHLIDYQNNYSSKEYPKWSTIHTLIIVNNDNVTPLFKLLTNLNHLVIDYHLLLTIIDNSYSIEQHLQEIFIHFQPNKHIQLDNHFKDQIRRLYGLNARILSWTNFKLYQIPYSTFQ